MDSKFYNKKSSNVDILLNVTIEQQKGNIDVPIVA